MNANTMNLILKAVEHARMKHPQFTRFGIAHAMSIAGEEYGELCKAFNEIDADQMVNEALDLIAVCVRIIEGDFMKDEKDRRVWNKR
jgi:NTP pyrophosphatase (non-canonical NTP hydrolase)